jgi:hypothetical protein
MLAFARFIVASFEDIEHIYLKSWDTSHSKEPLKYGYLPMVSDENEVNAWRLITKAAD